MFCIVQWPRHRDNGNDVTETRGCLPGLLNPFSSAWINTSLTHTHMHACMHTSSLWERERDATHLKTRCLDKMKVEVWREAAQRVCCTTSQWCSVCLCLASRWRDGCLSDGERWEWGRKCELLCCARDFTCPLGDCFSCTALVLFHILHLYSFCRSTIWQKPPVTTALYFLHSSPSRDGLELLIDIVVKREINTDWILCVWFLNSPK